MNDYLFDRLNNDKYTLMNENILLNELRKEKLFYRSEIGIPNYVTFGLELECENICVDKLIKMIIKKNIDWNIKIERSLNRGIEVNSPILTDNNENWLDLKIICDYLKRKNVNVNGNSGGHIHIGAHVLSSNIDNWINFLGMYSLYEDIIYKFCYGDIARPRKYINDYAKPISDLLRLKLLKEKINDIDDLKQVLPLVERNFGINFQNIMFNEIDTMKEKNTIEFRFPNASKNKITWQNNVNLLTKLVLYSKKDIDKDKLFYLLKNKKDYYLKEYNSLNISKAIHFVDEVFDNNLDKTYFLKQYIK